MTRNIDFYICLCTETRTRDVEHIPNRMLRIKTSHRISFSLTFRYVSAPDYQRFEIINSLQLSLLTVHHLDGSIKIDQLDVTCFIISLFTAQHVSNVSTSMWRVWVRRGECIGSWWGNRREGDQWEDLGVDGWIILGWISRRWDVGMWTGLGWPRIETDGGRLWVR